MRFQIKFLIALVAVVTLIALGLEANQQGLFTVFYDQMVLA